jgi:branched-chain amino acid transport system ATP-binding protein
MMDHIKAVREEGVTVLLVEHDMKAVMSTCDRIVVLSYGHKIAEGSPREISENQEVVDAYLGTDDGYR